MTEPASPPPAAAPATLPAHDKPWLRIGIEAGPLALFFLINTFVGRLYPGTGNGLFVATGAMIVVSVISLIVARRKLGVTPMMPLLSCAFVLVFGGLTLALQDEVFIKIKPTVFYMIGGLILLGSVNIDRPALKHVLGHTMRLTERGWAILSLRWGLFFMAAAAANEYVWRHYSTEFWAAYKLFGMLPASLIFATLQVPTMLRHAPPLPEGETPPTPEQVAVTEAAHIGVGD